MYLSCLIPPGFDEYAREIVYGSQYCYGTDNSESNIVPIDQNSCTQAISPEVDWATQQKRILANYYRDGSISEEEQKWQSENLGYCLFRATAGAVSGDLSPLERAFFDGGTPISSTVSNVTEKISAVTTRGKVGVWIMNKAFGDHVIKDSLSWATEGLAARANKLGVGGVKTAASSLALPIAIGTGGATLLLGSLECGPLINHQQKAYNECLVEHYNQNIAYNSGLELETCTLPNGVSGPCIKRIPSAPIQVSQPIGGTVASAVVSDLNVSFTETNIQFSGWKVIDWSNGACQDRVYGARANAGTTQTPVKIQHPTNQGNHSMMERFFQTNPVEAWYGVHSDQDHVFDRQYSYNHMTPKCDQAMGSNKKVVWGADVASATWSAYEGGSPTGEQVCDKVSKDYTCEQVLDWECNTPPGDCKTTHVMPSRVVKCKPKY